MFCHTFLFFRIRMCPHVCFCVINIVNNRPEGSFTAKVWNILGQREKLVNKISLSLFFNKYIREINKNIHDRAGLPMPDYLLHFFH